MSDEPTEPEPTPLRKATRSLYEHLGCQRQPHPYITSIGQGSERIVVMLLREPYPFEKQIPETWEGFPVAARVSGPFGLLGG